MYCTRGGGVSPPALYQHDYTSLEEDPTEGVRLQKEALSRHSRRRGGGSGVDPLRCVSLQVEDFYSVTPTLLLLMWLTSVRQLNNE